MLSWLSPAFIEGAIHAKNSFDTRQENVGQVSSY
jgi:hypothetical protein